MMKDLNLNVDLASHPYEAVVKQYFWGATTTSVFDKIVCECVRGLERGFQENTLR